MILLEEPQAALYSWIQKSAGGWRKMVRPGEIILVVDVGGGTSDFSLIAVLEQEGILELHRVAVGEHILLGGDNMDLALAYAVAGKLFHTRHQARCLAAPWLDACVPHREGNAAQRRTDHRRALGHRQSWRETDRRVDPQRTNARRAHGHVA